ncbi:MAG: DUF1285 domain-containing protein [Pseudomonadota bacterium]
MSDLHPSAKFNRPGHDLSDLIRAAQKGATGGLPPVEKWHPDFCGDLDMEIQSDGTWFYLGTPIGRAALVNLFASVLIEEDGSYFLVTPVEKVGLRVEDAPFVAVEMAVQNEGQTDQLLVLRTNVGDLVEIGAEHPLRFAFEGQEKQLKPYVLVRDVRGRLEALFARPLLYQLVDLGEEVDVDGVTMFAVRSGGQTFPIMPADELARLST